MKSLLLILLLSTNFYVKSQTMYFPPINGSTWDTINPLSLGYCQENIDQLNEYLDQKNSKAFILLKDRKIVFEWYFDDFTKDSFYVWNSAAKTLTAFAIGIAQQEGFLNISDTTSEYLGSGWTSLAPEQEEKITIWNQLTMTSGLNHIGDHYCTDPSCLVYIAEPGTRWMYHNGPYTLLDQVIEEATGMNLNTFVSLKIKSLTGMNGIFVPIDYNNIFISTARSMARFSLLLLNEGIWDGTPVLNDQSYFQEMTNTSQNLNPSYGYLTWLNGKSSYMVPSPDFQISINESAVPNAPDEMYAALGKNGQIINVVPSQKLTFIRMGESDGVSLIGNQYNDSIWIKINELTCLNNQIEGNLDEKNIQLFPNPTNEFLTIKGLNKFDYLEIYDLNNKKIICDIYSKELNISHLNKGIYFIKIFSGEKFYFLKFVKD